MKITMNTIPIPHSDAFYRNNELQNDRRQLCNEMYILENLHNTVSKLKKKKKEEKEERRNILKKKNIISCMIYSNIL